MLKELSKVQLPERFIDYLMLKRENGMGYHIVDIHLDGDHILKNREILNCTYLILQEGETIETDDIVEIFLSREEV